MFSARTRSPYIAGGRRRPCPFRPRLEVLEDRCLLSAGTLDPTFGAGGLVTTAIDNRSSSAADLAIQPDGKIVAVGFTTDGNAKRNFGLARYQSNGALDAGFGSGGTVTTALAKADDWANTVVLQPDGKIVAGGTANLNNGPWIADNNWAFALARYNANGTLDTSFGGGGNKGKIITEVAAGATQEGIAKLVLLPGGKILAVGESQGRIALVRYNANGSLDTTFDGDGKLVLDLPGGREEIASAVVQPDGKIVVAGLQRPSGAEPSFLLVRLQANGSLDTTFDGDGVATGTLLSVVQDLVRQSDDGKLVAVGYLVEDLGGGATTTHVAVARFNVDGSPDAGFGGGDGVVVTVSPTGAASSAAGVALDSGGRIVVVGP